MKKLKALKPSLREKKRYLSFEIISDKSFNFHEVAGAITENFLKLFGEYGYSGANIQMFKDKFKNNKGLLKVSNYFVDEIKAIFAITKNINTYPVIIKSLKTSGILKKVGGL